MRYTIGFEYKHKTNEDESYSGILGCDEYGFNTIISNSESITEKYKRYIRVFDSIEEATVYAQGIARVYRKKINKIGAKSGKVYAKSATIQRFYPIKLDSSNFMYKLSEEPVKPVRRWTRDRFNQEADTTTASYNLYSILPK